ncbi:2-C-methyl-D-erythritol 4-phosphate cytidylyltransferase [Rhodococcus sp. 15-725-2-2b]|uniref:2-C-methyl-D-erythritol 4-phosphate cytidylyltransferase n=1 Tax=unclassified Rhodococcus (in: high G+C Gram-positive bacteria) TaxID=192944 RepID=UPI000B9BE8FE|nr:MULTISPECIES: 2-C-methyl-D-erythritol 4-phosphate cytidylyltransferase [unclassified Rhodococcus (in: high G+C Gram-positive bacteria)]OZC68739.1 2-C-methyl-D-erythritol 4-phosphate cytidylyltransferase [Rhodococcus sp. 06-469-3-2]OZC72388.1 2-C-methyl-D-erythritol 4-phosphate cytidylyltransferase [Rhodococcus sp. 06-418-5]OZD45417.1 2-C-methyl-D-erythritol 4-phosphate cytidylyltransferase [Rhodococcus sp. 06-1477-1A]OZE08363.1 2-C-methyl-D-erythritol 4-phosphate cytidylyltransferase [Rhodoc
MNGTSGDVVALVPAAGKGLRLGHDEPKAFVCLGTDSLLTRSVDGLRASGAVDRIVVIVPADLLDAARRHVGDDVVVVAGGLERTDSVRAGLAAVGDAAVVLVHDAARALTPPTLIARVVAEVRAGRSAVIPVLPVVDTIKEVDIMGAVVGTPDRASLRSVQTPQGFDADVLRRAYDAASDISTDDAGLVERIGETVHSIVGDALAFKITTPHDLLLAQALL